MFSDLYKSYKDYVRYLLKKSIYNKQDREDLEQEVWVRVWQKMDSIIEGKEKQFIRGVVWNVIGNYITVSKNNHFQKLPEDCVYSIVDLNNGPESIINLLSTLSSMLSKDEYNLFQDYYIRGYTQSEIAKMRGVTQAYISKQLNNIKGRLTDLK